MKRKLKSHPLGRNKERYQIMGYISYTTKVQSTIASQMRIRTNFGSDGRPIIQMKRTLKVIKASWVTNQQTRLFPTLLKVRLRKI